MQYLGLLFYWRLFWFQGEGKEADGTLHSLVGLGRQRLDSGHQEDGYTSDCHSFCIGTQKVLYQEFTVQVKTHCFDLSQ